MDRHIVPEELRALFGARGERGFEDPLVGLGDLPEDHHGPGVRVRAQGDPVALHVDRAPVVVGAGAGVERRLDRPAVAAALEDLGVGRHRAIIGPERHRRGPRARGGDIVPEPRAGHLCRGCELGLDLPGLALSADGEHRARRRAHVVVEPRPDDHAARVDRDGVAELAVLGALWGVHPHLDAPRVAVALEDVDRAASRGGVAVEPLLAGSADDDGRAVGRDRPTEPAVLVAARRERGLQRPTARVAEHIRRVARPRADDGGVAVDVHRPPEPVAGVEARGIEQGLEGPGALRGPPGGCRGRAGRPVSSCHRPPPARDARGRRSPRRRSTRRRWSGTRSAARPASPSRRPSRRCPAHAQRRWARCSGRWW